MTDAELLAQKFPNMSESTRRLNAIEDQIERAGGVLQALNAATPKAPRSSKPRMNNLELAFYDILLKRFQLATITPQFRLRVSAWNAPVQVHYTADFLVSSGWEAAPSGPAWIHTLYEVKDSRRPYHSDELNRPKSARHYNPWISQVILATWDGHNWTERQIA